jgi:hypothetical protein
MEAAMSDLQYPIGRFFIILPHITDQDPAGEISYCFLCCCGDGMVISIIVPVIIIQRSALRSCQVKRLRVVGKASFRTVCIIPEPPGKR